MMDSIHSSRSKSPTTQENVLCIETITLVRSIIALVLFMGLMDLLLVSVTSFSLYEFYWALVIHLDPNGTAAIGESGGQMGFGGIKNSIAVAFDIWQNPQEDKLGVDHVSIRSKGAAVNDAFESGLLGVPRPYPLADGKIHAVRILYHNDLQVEYFDKLVASPSLLPYLLGNGEHFHIGSLSVFMDDGIVNDSPLLSIPINLSTLLDLPADKAYVGFTASTGKQYAKHDILSWTFCDQDHCEPVIKSQFNYRVNPP